MSCGIWAPTPRAAISVARGVTPVACVTSTWYHVDLGGGGWVQRGGRVIIAIDSVTLGRSFRAQPLPHALEPSDIPANPVGGLSETLAGPLCPLWRGRPEVWGAWALLTQLLVVTNALPVTPTNVAVDNGGLVAPGGPVGPDLGNGSMGNMYVHPKVLETGDLGDRGDRKDAGEARTAPQGPAGAGAPFSAKAADLRPTPGLKGP